MTDETPPQATPLISVLIGTKDRPHHIVRCLKSVLTQTYPSYEVLILDDGSANPQPLEKIKMASTDGAPVRWFRNATSQGVARGRNKLMEAARGEIFCILDDDAYFAHPRCLEVVQQSFKSNPDIGILAGKILDHPDHGGTRILAPFGKWARLQDPGLTERKGQASFFKGGCHAISKTAYEKAGDYFTELIYGEEELDLSYRVLEAGFQITYEPEFLAHHVPGKSLLGPQGEGQELFHHVSNRFYIATRYLPAKYVVTYLAIWLGRYLFTSLKNRYPMQFFAGLREGVRLASKSTRAPLSPSTIQYLKKHHGRLWY